MKKMVAGIVVVLIAGAIVYGGWWFISRKSEGIPSPSQILAANPISISEQFTIPNNHEKEWTFSAPEGKAPGILSGSWHSSGKSAGIQGAHDDSLISFQLIGPNNDVLQRLDEHPISGNFSVHCDGTGKYTFKFNNGGLTRLSARNVSIDATYQPD